MRYDVRIVPELIEQWVREGSVVAGRCIQGLPVEARLVSAGAQHLWINNEWYVLLQFEDDRPGPPEDFTLVYERVEIQSVGSA